METGRRLIEILEAENGYVVSWCELGHPDKEVVLCSDVDAVTHRVAEFINTSWQK